jgi:hypothetical protein
MIFRISRQNAGWLKTILHKGRNRCMHDASASESMITVRPARPRMPRALKTANRTLFQDRFAQGQVAVKRPGKCVQLLVVYHQRQQSEQRVERELQQWQRQQQQ